MPPGVLSACSSNNAPSVPLASRKQRSIFHWWIVGGDIAVGGAADVVVGDVAGSAVATDGAVDEHDDDGAAVIVVGVVVGAAVATDGAVGEHEDDDADAVNDGAAEILNDVAGRSSPTEESTMPSSS